MFMLVFPTGCVPKCTLTSLVFPGCARELRFNTTEEPNLCNGGKVRCYYICSQLAVLEQKDTGEERDYKHLK